MNRVSIITESSLDKLNGNDARPKWEFESVKKNGFNDIQNYIPLYSKFFSLDERNFNNIMNNVTTNRYLLKI